LSLEEKICVSSACQAVASDEGWCKSVARNRYEISD
jgi:hypothetical protein